MKQCLIFLVPILLATLAREAHGGATMTLMSGQVVDLEKLSQEKSGLCCLPIEELGDFSPIVSMGESNGRFYAAYDKDCRDVITNDAYPTTFKFIYLCGKCNSPSEECPGFDGGLYLGLPGDWCVKEDNTYDPSVVCSLAAPVCDAGYSGKCIEVPSSDTVSSAGDAPSDSLTLMSGQVVNINNLYNTYGGQCCLPRTVLGDWSPITFMKGSGKFFVTNDAGCNSPIRASSYPVTFDYVYVCGGRNYDYVDGGVILLPAGGSCWRNDWYRRGTCWGRTSWCGSSGICSIIPAALLAPLAFRPWRAPGFRPPIRPHPPVWRPGFRPEHKPGQKPDMNWPGFKPQRPINRPGTGINRPTTLPAPLPGITTRPTPLPDRPSIGSGGSGPGFNRPTTRPAFPPSSITTRPAPMPTVRPTTRPAPMPTTRPTTRPAPMPTTRPSMTRPTTRPVPAGGRGVGGHGGRRGE